MACHRGPDSVGVCIDGIGCDERCENNDDCIDLKDCTSDTCLSNGLCESTPVQDGTPCAGGTCQSGACVLEGSVVPCSEQGIRNAIAAGSGSYTLDCDEPSPIVLTAEITIDDSDIILDGRGVTLDASNVEPPDETCFRVVEQVTVELSGFTLTGGSHAGVYNGANLTLANSTVTDNGVWGIDNDGVLTVINSTVSRNRGVLHRAQIENDGSLTLINSTVVGTAALSTGEFDEDRQYLTAIEGCIIRGSCTLQQALTSNGYNVESPGDTCGFDQGTDQVNVTTGQLNLQPLADNGGPTQTQALGEGSVAIDQIPADDCDVDIDQRGEPRPETGGTMCDVGAFEVQP
jgi:hypothetical protein